MRAANYSRWLFIICALSVLSGCKSKVEKAYDACMAQVARASAEAVGKENAKSEQEKAFADAAGTMLNTMGAATCGAIRKQCEADEQSAICQGLLAQYQ